MTPIYTGQTKLYPPKQDEELAEAIKRREKVMAKPDPLLSNQGRMKIEKEEVKS